MNGTTKKRINRGYKVADAYYSKAMKRAAKEKFPLANLLEVVVKLYSEGKDISIDGIPPKKWFEEMNGEQASKNS